MREHVSVTTPEGTTSTESVWDGQTLLAERDSDGTLYRYVHGPDGSPLSLVRTRPGGPDERFNYHTDALGSVVAITSEAGTVVASYRYGAFGELLATGGSDAALASRNPLRYRAYYYDTHSALYYLPARYYDPASARFLSPDPAPASAGDPRTLDRYLYCTGDPVNYYDPSGAYLAAGGGASKVSDEAIALAKDDLAAAIAVQDAYRATVAASYASGLSYDAAHAAAEVAAAERAAALAERESAGINWSLLPTRPDAISWGLMGAGAVGDIATGLGAIEAVTVPPAGVPAYKLAKGYNAVVDGLGIVYSGYQWLGSRNGSLGDVALSGLSIAPGVSTGSCWSILG
jgi:RHS repeat-associated protein